QLGQPVVADNRPGAGGNLGAEVAAKSPPDGYTIVLCAPSLAISPSLYSRLNYDPIKDFAPISLVASIPNVLLVHPSVPAKTLKELIALARSYPGRLNFGSGGVGTSNHLASEMLKGLAKVNIVHVPFKGSNQAMLSMIGGHVDMVVIGVPPAIPQIRTGKVRPLAVLSSARLQGLREVPTAKEAGMPNFEVITWYGVLAPAGTPREIVTRLNLEIVKMMGTAEMKERMTGAGFDPLSSSPERFAEFIRTETVRWAKVIRDAGVRVE
ncbi:MAG: tripartite tricarboxylate transporter substrate binding protein, partial [Betaproteobacteria bacterium]|nr:tripartite tricarboxylate transporter substrate binding protein [Betaproteobacteria bacterium]